MAKTWTLLRLLLAATVCTTCATSQVIQTTNGPVFTENHGENGVIAYKGIPYAAPPLGDLRWRSPMPPEPWTAPLNTTSFGSACYMFIPGLSPIPQSEDCLFVNVWTTADNPNSALPVMVFIHGGGFEADTALNPVYDGTRFAQAGVVLVSFDYRLGNFGFLGRTDLDDEDLVGNSGNFGLQDQILALRWVRDNIKAFGGDPENVVAFGESAGAHSIGLLMASPLARGLFDKAIIESGAWWESEHGDLTTFDEARQRGLSWGQNFGQDVSLEQLRALPAETVVNTSAWDFATDPGTTAFAPSIDRYVLPLLPSFVFAAGLEAKIPLLAGWNQDEGLVFEARSLPKSTPEEFRSQLSSFFDVAGRNRSETDEKLEALYPSSTPEETFASAIKWLGDLIISEQTWEAAHLHSRGGHATTPTYVYHFTYTSPYSPVAFHSSELPFVFGNLPNTTGSVAPSAEDVAFSDQVNEYWVNFARSSNPNSPTGGLPNWPRYIASGDPHYDNKSGEDLRLLELGTSIQPVENVEYGRFDFIRSYRGPDRSLPIAWRG